MAVREGRKKAMNMLKKADLPKDDERKAEQWIQNVIDDAIEQVGKLGDSKVRELTSS